MTRLLKYRLVLALVALFAILAPLAVYGITRCNRYSDGCTICDFYDENDKYVGYIEWCH